MRRAAIPLDTYETYAEMFNPQFFDADEWVALAADLTELKPKVGTDPAGRRYGIPLTRWRDSHDFQAVAQAAQTTFFEHGDVMIPAEASYVDAGLRDSFSRKLDIERAYDLALVDPGETVYVADEFDQKSWRFTVGPDGRLRDPSLFAEEGEAGAVALPSGNVLIAAGDLRIYSPDGAHQSSHRVPGRPTALRLAGPDQRTLYVLARTRLFSLPLDALGE